MRTLLALLLLQAGELDKARELVRALKYPEALKALEKAEASSALDLNGLAEVYELQGVVLANLKRPDAAVAAFEKLLTLSPEHRFDSPRAPRVMTPYYEARERVKRSGPLLLELLPEGDVVVLKLSDPLAMVKEVKVKVTEDGQSRVLPVTGFPVRITSTATVLDVAATALSARQQVLQQRDLHFEKPKPAAAPPPPAPAAAAVVPVEEAPPAVVEAAPQRRWMTGKRITGIVLLGIGVALGAIGFSFGISSRQGRDEFQAALDGSVPLSPSDARALSNDVVAFAWTANVNFAAAGLFGLIGLGLLLFGG